MKILFLSQGYENLSIEYLTASLKSDNDFEIKLICDPCLFAESGFINIPFLGKLLNIEKKILPEIIAFKPDLTVFSVISDNFKWATNLASKIKESTNSLTIAGGIHPTSSPASVLAKKCFDYICIGEGETSLLSFCQELKNGKKPDYILGIVRDGFLEKAAPVLEDVNKLPLPDKDIYYKNYPYINYGYITTASRGCPYACAYCANSVLSEMYKGKHYRQRNSDHVIAELKEAKNKYNPKFIHFTDESFNISKKACEDFLQKYKTEINLPFSCYLYPDNVNEENAKALASSGCFKVQMGIQNANPAIRKELYLRNSDNEKIVNAIKTLKTNKIFVSCDNIIGAYNETDEDVLALCEMYEKTPPDACETYILRLYPNTKLTKIYAEKNIIDTKTLRDINNADTPSGLFDKNAAKMSAKKRALIIYMRIITFLPKNIATFTKSLKIHYVFAYLPLWFIIVINKLIKKPQYDIYTKRTFRKYKFFIRKKFL